MPDVIRINVFLSFIVLSVLASACGIGSPGIEEGDANRPLILPDASIERPKIIAFGDSLTAGFGLAETESYPYLLQERLKADGYDYEVVNAGVSGDTSLGGAERAEWVLDQDNVKILILELGANDLLRGMPVERMKNNLESIILEAKARDIEVVLCGMFAPPSMGAEYARDYRNAFADLADEQETIFIPFLLQNIALNRDLNQADGIHPNAAGTRIMMENIYRELRPMLKD